MLINCPECKKEISDQASNCPNCGYPIKNNSSSWENIKVPTFDSIMATTKTKNKSYLTACIIAGISGFLMWFWKESHGVAIAEAEINYTILGYMDSILFTSRIITIALPVAIFACIVFLILYNTKKK